MTPSKAPRIQPCKAGTGWWRSLGTASLIAIAIFGLAAYPRLDEGRRSSELIGAVYSGDVGRVRAMLDHGAKANRANLSGFTPLMRSVTVPPQLVRAEVVELLLARGADPNVRDERGETALDIAVTNRLPAEVIRALVRHGGKRGPELR
jgi:ankyrin repeat protein